MNFFERSLHVKIPILLDCINHVSKSAFHIARMLLVSALTGIVTGSWTGGQTGVFFPFATMLLLVSDRIILTKDT